jgi:hypothetical protein
MKCRPLDDEPKAFRRMIVNWGVQVDMYCITSGFSHHEKYRGDIAMSIVKESEEPKSFY